MRTPETWPDTARRRPARSSPTYATRAPLALWLQEEARRASEAYGRYRVLDVGCGVKPYFPFFEPYSSEYVGVDLGSPGADLEGSVESLPVADASFEVVLCTQVLEHVGDPARAVRELRRVVVPGGRVLASTHGTYVYHPAPDDLWRWTHTGLERLFRENGSWSSLTVRPGSGSAACVGMLVAVYVDLLARRARVSPVGRLLVTTINRIAEAVDSRSFLLRNPGPGTIFANYHVVAEAPA